MKARITDKKQTFHSETSMISRLYGCVFPLPAHASFKKMFLSQTSGHRQPKCNRMNQFNFLSVGTDLTSYL